MTTSEPVLAPTSFVDLAQLCARLRELAEAQAWDDCLPLTKTLHDCLLSGTLHEPLGDEDRAALLQMQADFADMLERAEASHADMKRLLWHFGRAPARRKR